MEVFVDCGASISLCTPGFARRMGLSIKEDSGTNLVLMDKSRVRSEGRAYWRTRVSGRDMVVGLQVMEECCDEVVFGLDWLRTNRVKVDFADGKYRFGTEPTPTEEAGKALRAAAVRGDLVVNHLAKSNQEAPPPDKDAKSRLTLPREVAKFKALFDNPSDRGIIPAADGRRTFNPQLKPDWKPWTSGRRRYTTAEILVGREHIADELSKGWIRKVNNPKVLCQPTFAQKQDGDIRFCIDFTNLNKQTVHERFEIPLIPEIIQRAAGKRRYFKIDITAAFHTIPNEPGTEWMTAFTFEGQAYEYLVMPFGVQNGPSVWQSEMQAVLEECIREDGVCVYLDDILGYADTSEELARIRDRVMTRLQDRGVTVKPSKCEWDTPSVVFCGFLLSEEGYTMDPERIRLITDWPEPSDLRDVRALVGWANYHRDVIKRFSELVAPLTHLTKKGVAWAWGTLQQAAFTRLKEVFLSPEIIAPFDWSLGVNIEVDASDRAIACVLSQDTPDGPRQVALASRLFSDVERRWTTTVRELFGIIWTMMHFRYFMYGRKVKVYSDHSALGQFTTTMERTPKMMRWLLDVVGIDFEIQWRPGKDMQVDHATRRSCDGREGDGRDYGTLLGKRHFSEAAWLDLQSVYKEGPSPT